MLVITRKTDESITVSENIEITVLEISKDKVKLGIKAPKEINIYRSELKLLRSTNEQAAHPSESAIKQLLNSSKQEEI